MSDKEECSLLALAEQAQANFNSVEGAAMPGLDPLPGQEPAAPEIDPQEALQGEALIVVGMFCKGVEFAFPVLSYPDELKQEAAAKLAPLIEKYGGMEGLSFLKKWEHEIAAGLFFGGVAVASYQAVKADNAAKAQAKVDEASGD